MKERGEKISVLTAYDYPTARLLDEVGIDFLLVGDSLGMVVLGYPDTTLVTMDEMLHHTRAVARGAGRVPVVADLPWGTCDTVESTLYHARRLCDAGAHAVKLEGGVAFAGHIAALVADGIPTMGHIGMLPQRVRIEGGYKRKGRSAGEAEALVADAVAIEQAGASGMVVELVAADAAAAITAAVGIPTIGIGSGESCDGQVRVIHDIIGAFPWFQPKFAKPRAAVASEIQRAVREFMAEVRGN